MAKNSKTTTPITNTPLPAKRPSTALVGFITIAVVIIIAAAFAFFSYT